jgi:hypothetical protein
MNAKDWRPTSFVETAPGVAMGEGEDDDRSRIERLHPLYDHLRQLTALDAGALVLVASLIEKAFAQPLQREWAGIAVAAFFVSLLCASAATLVLLANGPGAGAQRTSSVGRRVAALAAVATLLGFLLGMGALAWFFLVNWFR